MTISLVHIDTCWEGCLLSVRVPHHRTHSFREGKYWRNSMIHTGVLLLIDLVAGSLCEPKIRVYMHDLLKVIIVVIACFTRLRRIDMH